MKSSAATATNSTWRIVRCYVYARISQDRTGAHLGTERQIEDCHALAKRLSTPDVVYEVVRVFEDNDLSAYSGKPRKDYLEMLQGLGDGDATVVLAWHTDRLHRSPTELEAYIALSEKRSVLTHTVQAGLIDLSTPHGRMTARILGAVARQESEHKGARVARKRQQKAKAGEWGGGIRPFGWGMPTGETRKKIVKATGEEIEVPVLDMDKAVPKEAAAIKYGTDLLLSGGSIQGFSRWLRDEGILSTQGNAIRPTDTRLLLLRPRNAGIAIYQGQEIGRGSWEPIVTEAEFRGVVAVLKNPARTSARGSKPKWLGSLIYRCGQPGCTERTKCGRGGSTSQPGYRCITGHGGARQAERVDRYISDLIVKRLSRPDAVDLLEPGPDDVDVAGLQLQSDQTRQRLVDLAALFGSGHIDMAQFAQGSDTARAQLAVITKSLERAGKRDPLVSLVGAPDVGKAWKALELDRRRSVLKSLMDVTILPLGGGRRSDEDFFRSIHIVWKR
ncbi:recombinase family protein [Streptomyces sp. NBC_01571]|uniref:recombinase family protein n=1 Tax=Streptomyces sp. NBC_01571 TaxID=2975883 RepID=UPI00224D9FEC|nr:recombinase family protein [Streptomyces sp. NBC_01571]MCX4578153.1 recombinase family protein [Streptomyces sp. NBC_01571]